MRFISVIAGIAAALLLIFGLSKNSIAQEKRVPKLTLAVLPFSSAGIKDYEAVSLSNRLHSELVKTKRFKVVEIEKVEALLKEIAFHQSGIFREEYVAHVGKMLGAQLILAGSVGKVGNTYTVDVRIISVQSRRVIKASTGNSKGKTDDLLQLMNDIARELAHPKAKKKEVARSQKNKKWLWIAGGTAVMGTGIMAMILTRGNESAKTSNVIGTPPDPPGSH